MSSVGENVQVQLHEHRFLTSKLLEALHTAAKPPSSMTSMHLRTLKDMFNRVLDKDRDLLAAVKELETHQRTQKTLQHLNSQITMKKQIIWNYANTLYTAQEEIQNVLRKHKDVISHAKKSNAVALDPKDVIAYAHRIAGTTSAPRYWKPGFPMFGFLPPAPQEHMMRAGVLSRGIIAEIVTQDIMEQSTIPSASAPTSNIAIGDVPIGLGASAADIRSQMPPGWNPGDPVDLPLDALLHYLGRSFFQEQGITLPENWKTGDPLPNEAIEVVKKKFKIGIKRGLDADGDEKMSSNNESEDDRGSKRAKLEEQDEEENSDDSDSSESESEVESQQRITLSLSSDDNSSDEDD